MPVVVASSTSGVETIEWVEPDGTVLPFTQESGVMLQDGLSGRFLPPVAFAEEETPGRDGSRLRSARHTANEVALPVVFKADDYASLRVLLRDWTRRLAPKRGDGRLRVTPPDGLQRETVCRLSGSLGIAEGISTLSGAQQAVLVFRAFDPFWYDVTETSGSWGYTAGTSTAFFPIFPLRLTSSAVFSSPTIVNTGDVEAWPVWTIGGPVADLTLSNNTTGEHLTITGSSFPAGNTLVIDTRPGAKTVILNGSQNLFPYLSADSSLWSLQPGENSIDIEMGGADTPTTVTMAYKRRWLSA